MGAYNPIGFRPFQVSFWTTVIYLAVFIPLIFVHESVPTPPADTIAYSGLNLTKAWSDLLTITRAYHPFNSRENDNVHSWLLLELEAIQRKNGADKTDFVIFDDNVANVTAYPPTKSSVGGATYFEGTNIIVYIRGKDDPEGKWWEEGRHAGSKPIGKGGVLLNAHYDSVSTGFGATDDGMGCATVLSLVDFFSQPDNQPQRGIVALLNNNEEDWLWGAQAFAYHPMLPFCHTFLNLEGAGAGGRATIFRTTDAEVTGAYRNVRHPFGTVISSDAFGLGVIKSGTDFSIFVDDYGLRGLDMAFYKPRARYHTNQDDAKHASRASLWHMLSNALETMKALSGDTGDTFIGERGDGESSGKVENGQGTTGVWFDIFGQVFAVFDLRTFFAWSLTLLIAGPIILLITSYILARSDRYYYFSSRILAYEGSVPDPIKLGGRKGIIRFPFALAVAGALTVGAAYLLAKFNPLVVYSNEYTVWAMMLSLFYFVFWTIMAGANFARPSALHRGYAIIWVYAISWILLVVDTVFEDRFNIASGYVFVFLNSAAFLAVLLALLEQFGLTSKLMYALQSHPDHHVGDDHLNSVPHAEQGQTAGGDEGENEESFEATETTPLVRSGNGNHHQTTFGGGYRQRPQQASRDDEVDTNEDGVYEHEQPWSAGLPSWLWFFQFLILGPFLLIIIGQSGLLIVSSVSQTGVDGSSTLVPYLMAAFFSIMLVLPVTPFTHRITHHVPLLLLVVFIGTLIWNLVVFPFTEDSRAKIYFQQTVNLDTGASEVSYSGVAEYVDLVVDELPSAMGKQRRHEPSVRSGLVRCAYDGVDVLPSVVPGIPDGVPPEKAFASWITFNVTRGTGETNARFIVDAKETRVCAISFEKPISGFKIKGARKPDERFGSKPERGLSSISLYRRDWSSPWTVDVEWEAGASEEANGMDGHVVCDWSDVNTAGYIPAYDEGLQYAPSWAALTKLGRGLVTGSKAFKI